MRLFGNALQRFDIEADAFASELDGAAIFE
jgi:hypothetical protein